MKRIGLIFLPLFIGIKVIAQSNEPNDQAINPNVKEIIVIFKTHYDIGYTNRVKDVVQYFRTGMVDKVLDLMDKTRDMPTDQQFRWTVSGWVMAKVLEDWDGQIPERSKRVQEAFKSGQIVSYAAPFTVQSEIMFPEDFARFYEPSSSIARKYDLPLPRGAKMTDVPSQGSVLATGLAQAGVEFVHIGCNWPSGEVKYPPLFWWEGPDGSRVLTLYSPFYGTIIIDYSPDSGGRDAWCGRNLIPPSAWPYPVWPAIIVTGDNSGPPDINYVKGIFEEAAKKMPGVKIRFGQLEDFADAILATNPVLPVIKAEAPDTWIHGVMSDPGGMKIFRNVNPRISTLEVLNTQLGNWNVATGDITKDISKAYENSVLYSEHIWGYGDNINQYEKPFKSFPPESYRTLEQSWEDKTDFIRTTENIIKPLLISNLTALAQHVKIEGNRIIVYNPLPWIRSEWVEVGGKPDYFYAENIPPCGYKAFSEEDLFDKTHEISNSDLSAQTIENRYYKIKIDAKRCIISSLIDKSTGREWADTLAEYGLGQYLNERFTFEQTEKYVTDYQRGRGLNAFGTKGNWLHPGMYKPGMISEKQVPYRAATSKNGSLKITREVSRETAVMDIPGDSANHFPFSSLTIILQKDKPFFDIELTIRNKEKDNWPEADWFCFPFKINSPKFTVGRSLGMMDPVKDIMEGSNKDLYAVGTGVTITDEDGSGVGFCPFDHPIVSLDRPGIWKFTGNFVPRKPIIYHNLYNNQWNTTYRYWYPGSWSSKVRIWTFSGDPATESSLVTPSLEARMPLLVAEADGKAGNMPREQAGITISRKGIQVTAFRHNSSDNPVYAWDGSGFKPTLLRLWEQGGISGDVTISLPKGYKYSKATPVNLRGQVTGKQIPIKSGRLTFFLHAYSPASYVLE